MSVSEHTCVQVTYAHRSERTHNALNTCRRTAISFVCSTWDLPVLCPPLLGLHTLETGVRCAAGDCVSPLGHVAVVAAASRCALPDGAIGNIWVASGGAEHAVTRGIHAVPLQWVFDAARNERKGPYKVTGTGLTTGCDVYLAIAEYHLVLAPYP